MKKSLLTVLIFGMLVASGFLLAAEPTNQDYTWTEVGDGFFEVWDLNGPLFVENVENYNRAKLAEARRAGEKFRSWDDIRPNRTKWHLRLSKVRYRDQNDAFQDLEQKIFFRQVTYGQNQTLHLKGIRDGERVRIAKDDNAPGPFIQNAKNSNYAIFTAEDGIWGIKPILKDVVNFEVTKLSKDTINGKTQAEIRDTLNEHEILLWNEHPLISSDGNYVAYLSNKDSYQKNMTSFEQARFELWILNVNQSTDNLILSEPHLKKLKIYGWVNGHTLIYSLDNDIYLYNPIDKTNLLALEDITLLTFNEHTFVYFKNTKAGKIYTYNYLTKTETASPSIPGEAVLTAHFLPNHYSISPDGSKLLVFLYERNNANPEGRKIIYLIDYDKNSINTLTWPGMEKNCLLGKWLANQEAVIYTSSSNAFTNVRTWVISVNS